MSGAEQSERPARHAVLVTGAAGYVGSLVVAALARERRGIDTIVATDLREVPAAERAAGVVYHAADINSAELRELVGEHGIDTVVHLAAVVTPPPGDRREAQHAVDVLGTDNVVAACLEHGVRKLVYTSSGAAYGYLPDNPPRLTEEHPLRAHEEMAYAWHKRLVEERLAKLRDEHPELEQLVLRVSTVLGETVANQITALFERPVVIGLAGVDSPFCFVRDADLVRIILDGVHGEAAGVYNVTGDGVLTLREIARAMGRAYVPVPEPLLGRTLDLLYERGLAVRGSEALLFLRHRPVLANDALKRDLGGPLDTSREVFERYRRARGAAGSTADPRGASRWQRLASRLLLR